MAFTQESTKTPASIGNVVVTLKDSLDDGEGAPYQAAYYDVRIVMSDGSEVVRRGNLVPHITTAQRNALMDFMDALRVQAEGEFLP